METSLFLFGGFGFLLQPSLNKLPDSFRAVANTIVETLFLYLVIEILFNDKYDCRLFCLA